jgi:hypothetical protein
MRKRLLVLLLGSAFASFAIYAGLARASTKWFTGDVFAAINGPGGSYKVFDRDGTFKEQINQGLAGFTTGCAFGKTAGRAEDNLYTTNFAQEKVVVFEEQEPHNIVQVIDTSVGGNQGPESIVFNQEGDFFVGNADGAADILRFDENGTFKQAYNVATEGRGSDWIDLARDQETMFYTSEGRRILRFNVETGMQMPDFAVVPSPGQLFALRLLLPQDGRGGLVVADSINIKRLDGTGTVVQTYDAPGENNWFSIALDPEGAGNKFFWAGDSATGNFYKFNIRTGAIEVGPVSTGAPNSFFGLCTDGETTAGRRG